MTNTYHLLPLLEAGQRGRAIAKQLGLEFGADALERERLCVGVDGFLVTASLRRATSDQTLSFTNRYEVGQGKTKKKPAKHTLNASFPRCLAASSFLSIFSIRLDRWWSGSSSSAFCR
jgi:hypothetical protein